MICRHRITEPIIGPTSTALFWPRPENDLKLSIRNNTNRPYVLFFLLEFLYLGCPHRCPLFLTSQLASSLSRSSPILILSSTLNVCCEDPSVHIQLVISCMHSSHAENDITLIKSQLSYSYNRTKACINSHCT